MSIPYEANPKTSDAYEAPKHRDKIDRSTGTPQALFVLNKWSNGKID